MSIKRILTLLAFILAIVAFFGAHPFDTSSIRLVAVGVGLLAVAELL